MSKFNKSELELIKTSIDYRKQQIVDHPKEFDKLNNLNKIVNSKIIYLKSKQKRKLIGCISDYVTDKKITADSKNGLWNAFASLQEQLIDKPKEVITSTDEKEESQ